jgi:hypothetical protein
MVILAGVFKFQPLDGTIISSFRNITLMWTVNSLIISVCLRRAGEILPVKIPSEEIHENKFSQLMKNKTVHLLTVFLMAYTGVEATIGGIIRSLILLRNKKMLITVN